MRQKIENPILRGFHPDPSIICVEGTFFIANSTFEYFPGVEMHASEDLMNWRRVKNPLDSVEFLDMKGNPKSGGIWAPCLSYSEGWFYLVFTDVKSWADGPFKDTPNFVTKAREINGPWTKPVFLNCSGFDASLFHDEDGKKYLLNMEWDYRKSGDQQFSGILLTEVDVETLLPISNPVKIYKGTERGLVEGPHLYKKDGYYYLITAEGGTTYNHAMSVARAENIMGPYENHPQRHLVSSTGDPTATIQKAGHGSLCQSPDGRWYAAFLCGRPLPGSRRCPLGRETSMAEVIWEDGWPYIIGKGLVPEDYFFGPELASRVEVEKQSELTIESETSLMAEPANVLKKEYEFSSEEFRQAFMSLRVPAEYDVLGTGVLRLYGKESLSSRHFQNMLVRRQEDFNFRVETCLSLNAKHFQTMAGLIYRYDEQNQIYLRVAYNEDLGCNSVGLLSFDKNEFSMVLGSDEIQAKEDKVYLALTVKGSCGHFSYALEDRVWKNIEVNGKSWTFDVSRFSDEYADPMGFTGAFVGMSCQDMAGYRDYADFYSFSYEV